MQLVGAGPLLARRYRLDERIAVGGFGEVWRGTDVVLARPVAVKLLLAGYGQPEMLARFRAEARHAAALCHEGIAQVYDYIEPVPPEPPFLVMELVSGPSLARILSRGPLEPWRTLDVVAQVAEGLQAAHEAGVVHRDIKPGNLLIGDDGVVKITDFGISYAEGSAPLTDTGRLVGTAAYLAPERVGGARATPASDLYSLGVVAFECLAGEQPFAGTMIEVALAHRDCPLPPLPAAVPPQARELVLELTAKDPGTRPGSAGELAHRAARLRDRIITGAAAAATTATTTTGHGPALRDLPPAHGHRRPAGPAGTATRRAAGLVAAIAVLALAGLALSSVISQGPRHRPAALPTGTPRPHVQADRFINVDVALLTGRPVRAVARLLRRRGLEVGVCWRPSSLLTPGTVIAVRPGGRLKPGSQVIVTGALLPDHAQHGGDGAHGGGQGDHGDHGDHGGQGDHGNHGRHGGHRGKVDHGGTLVAAR